MSIASSILKSANPKLIASIESNELPEVPEISSLNTRLPHQSTRRVVKTVPFARFKIWANSDNSSKEAWVDDVPDTSPADDKIGQPILLNYWDGGPPAQYILTLRQYWQQVPGTYTRLPEGNTQTITYTHTTGISVTDTETLEAELGASGGGLSAKVTATFGHSVTTSSQDTTTESFVVSPPAAGKIRVWVAWQLVDEIVALDVNDNIIPADPNPKRKGEVCWKHIPGFDYHSGAFMSYKSTQHTFPSNEVIHSQKDFDAPA